VHTGTFTVMVGLCIKYMLLLVNPIFSANHVILVGSQDC